MNLQASCLGFARINLLKISPIVSLSLVLLPALLPDCDRHFSLLLPSIYRYLTQKDSF